MVILGGPVCCAFLFFKRGNEEAEAGNGDADKWVSKEPYIEYIEYPCIHRRLIAQSRIKEVAKRLSTPEQGEEAGSGGVGVPFIRERVELEGHGVLRTRYSDEQLRWAGGVLVSMYPWIE